MLIDWFTVGAQTLNFVVLVWLLKRTLYKPIMAAIEAREASVSAQLTDAAAQNAKALAEVAEFKAKNEAIDRQRSTLLSEAAVGAAAEGKRMMQEARAGAEAWQKQRQQSLESAAESMNQLLSVRVQQQVFAIARRTLADLATASLEERATDLFCEHLRTMTSATKAQLEDALHSTTSPAQIRSAFDLTPQQRAAIQSALDTVFSPPVQVHYEMTPELIAGVELTANGCRISWSIASYLSDLERAVNAVINAPKALDRTLTPASLPVLAN